MQKIDEKSLRWFLYVNRTESSRLPRWLRNGNLEKGRNRRGRLRKRRNNNLKQNMEIYGLKKVAAADRIKWRRKLHLGLGWGKPQMWGIPRDEEDNKSISIEVPNIILWFNYEHLTRFHSIYFYRRSNLINRK